jgi:hypothetical protein
MVPFAYGEQQVRTVTIDGEPWFVAADVCAVLGLESVARAVSRLDADDRGVRPTHTPGGVQNMTVVNEPGLYEVLFKQRQGSGGAFNVPKRAYERYFELIDEWVPGLRRYVKVPLITPEGQVVLAELLLENGWIAP